MARPRVRHQTKRLVRLYAIVVEDGDGLEGVVRRDTPSGSMALVTDDPGLAPELLRAARALYPTAYLATFTRAE